MKNILITGGAGYIGSVLSEQLLKSGYNVTVYDNFMYHQQGLFHLCANPNFNVVVGDIRDHKNLQSYQDKADVIMHLACIVGAPACNRDIQLSNSVNYFAVEKICEYKSNDQLLIYPTTNSGYGTQSGEVYCTEETPLEPISMYGHQKVNAEKRIMLSPNTISLRLATVFGASPRMRMDLLVNDFVYRALTDKALILFEKDFKRNFVYIRDVADCFEYCAENADKLAGNIYNLGNDDENMSKLDLANKLKKYIPELEIYESQTGKDPDKRNYIVSSKKLENAGFKANTSIDSGITELRHVYNIIGSLKLGNV